MHTTKELMEHYNKCVPTMSMINGRFVMGSTPRHTTKPSPFIGKDVISDNVTISRRWGQHRNRQSTRFEMTDQLTANDKEETI